ncbi:hypothetical protein ACE6H2_026789 [Prunus campanulata]
MATELMETAEDTCVWHRFVGWSPRRRFGCAGSCPSSWSAGYPGCLGWEQNIEVAEVGFPKATLEGAEGGPIISIWAARILMTKAGCILPEGFIFPLTKHGCATEGRREKETHALITKALASEGRLEGMDMGEGVLRACVRGNTKWLNALLLVVVEDTLSEGPRARFSPEGLVAAVLLALEASHLLKEEAHGRVGMRDSVAC